MRPNRMWLTTSASLIVSALHELPALATRQKFKNFFVRAPDRFR